MTQESLFGDEPARATRERERPPSPRTNLLTRKQLALALEVHPQTIAKWIEEGLPVAVRGKGGRPSRYDEQICRAWKDAREQLAQEEAPVDLVRERARKERAQALLAEQLYAMRSRALLPSADVEKAWTAEIMAARAIILTAYLSASDRVYRAATVDGLAGVERELKGLAEDALAELSTAGARTEVA